MSATGVSAREDSASDLELSADELGTTPEGRIKSEATLTGEPPHGCPFTAVATIVETLTDVVIETPIAVTIVVPMTSDIAAATASKTVVVLTIAMIAARTETETIAALLNRAKNVERKKNMVVTRQWRSLRCQSYLCPLAARSGPGHPFAEELQSMNGNRDRVIYTLVY
ncbi:hypothetical protein G6O67_002667 [Ophiocordyceps sinensis]|uniref:Uncharacterized protein n=2 Tax=Ophiocordyceps sinensis TaxID=72228 RepID=A0A8H4PUQ0_9HYPO|nr:hypothetical protein OCS_03077 [Ophiocordyceps sinensis CO18]KAF4510802.1 hypothetical protein G6O67_002667 [Ophiocordyceps sinensis]